MKPLEQLDEARAPDGTRITLTRQDAEFMILADGKPLMSSRMYGSEAALATLGCRDVPRRAPRVLVGGLGMGFTLRAALDAISADAVVVVSELIPAVIEWNRGPLGALAAHPLNDPRVRLEIGDVRETLRSNRAAFDAVLLDVDNGPDAFSAAGNDSLYSDEGITAARDALKPGGVFAVWSVREDRQFVTRLKRAGFQVTAQRVRARSTGRGSHHTVFVALTQPSRS